MITNDSGPMHMAVAMGTPTVSFFGPETPLLYGPRGKKHKVLYVNLGCSPCITNSNAKNARCKHSQARCMNKISVDEAYKAAEELL